MRPGQNLFGLLRPQQAIFEKKVISTVADLKTHCEDCVRELGEPFEEVHRWLDEFYETHGAAHREFRHHHDGVEEVRQR